MPGSSGEDGMGVAVDGASKEFEMTRLERASRGSFRDATSSPSWPATFEKGVDRLASSPAAEVMKRMHAPSYDEQTRLLVEQMEHGMDKEMHKSKATFNEAVANSINMLLGVGVLSSPFALRSSGWLVGVPMLIFFAVVTNHTGKLLGKCLQYQEGMMTYPDIGEAAFGTKGRALICVVFFTELFCAGAMLNILVGDTLGALFPSYPPGQLMVIAFACILPTFWTAHLSMLSYLSALGVVSSFVCLYAVAYIGLAIDPSAPGYTMGSMLHPQNQEWLADADRIPLSIGLTMVAFGGHSVFPSICSSMRNPAQYPRMLDVTYVVVVAVYGAIEMIGYLMFGTSTTKEITLNLIAVYPGWLTQAVTWMIVINPMSKLSLTQHPIALAFEELVFTREQMEHETTRVKFLRAVIRSAIGIAGLLCALSVPHFARVTSFLGAFFAILASIVLPCACYLKLFWRHLDRSARLANISLAVIAFVLAILGSISSFISPAE